MMCYYLNVHFQGQRVRYVCASLGNAKNGDVSVECQLFITFYSWPAVRDPLPNCIKRTPFLESCNFMLFVGEWSFLSTKWGIYVIIVSLKMLFSNIADIKHPRCLWTFTRRGLENKRKEDTSFIIVKNDQQDATILAYLFIPNQLYMFRAMFSPITRSTWLYLQLLILSTDVAAGWCHVWDGTHEFHLVHDTSRQQYRWKISEAVNTIKCSWWWTKTWPETCRAD